MKPLQTRTPQRIMSFIRLFIIPFFIVESIYWILIYVTLPEIDPACAECSVQSRSFHVNLYGITGSTIAAILIVPFITLWLYKKIGTTRSWRKSFLVLILSAMASYFLLMLIFKITDFPSWLSSIH